MYDFSSVHIGKELYRAKEHEEDIKIINEIAKVDFSISLKAYGDGPLQLSTDKNSFLFPYLKSFGKEKIADPQLISNIFTSNEFSEFGKIHVFPLIYDEKNRRCNIMIFDFAKAKNSVTEIILESSGKGRIHPVFRFYDNNNNYICEVRYGGASANALQRGLWTNSKHATSYFNSITNGWIDYSDNTLLVKLFSYALVSTSKGHQDAIGLLARDIDEQKNDLSF